MRKRRIPTVKEKKGRKAKGYDGWSHDAERRLCAPKKIDATQQNEKNEGR
jgi:hypothetical protein